MVILACFFGGFLYFGLREDTSGPTTSPQGSETVVNQPSSIDEFVAITIFICGLILYGFCPVFRVAVNVIFGVALGGALLKRLGDN